MQSERFVRMLVLPLFFGSMAALSTVYLKDLPQIALIPVLLIIFSITIEIARKRGKFVGLGAILAYFALFLFSRYITYGSSMVLSLALLTFPFLWSMEIKDHSLDKTLDFLGIRRDRFWNNALVGIVAVVPIAVFIFIGNGLIILSHLEEPGKVAKVMLGMPFYILIFSFTITPLAEEFFFRGFLLRRIGLIPSTLIFTIAHFSYWSLTEFFGAFSAGIAFALLYRNRNSLITSIFSHAAFNLANILLLLYLPHVMP